jgi:HSP20 family molecular chaperone IbpA/CBS domain-containing protein
MNGVGLYGEPVAEVRPYVEAKLSLVESTSPPVQQRKTRHHYELKVDVPGVRECDLDVSYSGNTLKIWGERSDNRTGRPTIFEMVHTFPEAVNFQKAEVSLCDGVLTVLVPLKDEHRLHIGSTCCKAIMTRDPIYCRDNDRVEEVIKKMIDSKHSFLPVCEQHSERVVAVVTWRDILSKCLRPSQGGFDGGTEIRLVRSQRLVFVQEELDVRIAAKHMETNSCRRVPVCDVQQRLVGVLSASDCVSKPSPLSFEAVQPLFGRRHAQATLGSPSMLGGYQVS